MIMYIHSGGHSIMNMTIKTKLILAFSVLVTLVFAMGLSSMYFTEKIVEADKLQAERFDQISIIKNYDKKVIQITLTSMDIIVDRQELKVEPERTAQLKKLFTELKEMKDQILISADTEEEKASSLYIVNAVEKLEPIIMTKLHNYVNTGAEKSKFDEIDNEIDEASGELEDNISKIIKSISGEVKESKEYMESTAEKSITLNIVILIVILFLTVLSAILTLRAVLNPVRKMTIITADLAEGDGDLTKRVVSETNDEMKTLGDNINKFIHNVHEVVSEISDQSHALTSSSTELAATTEELASTFNEQNAQVSEVASAMEEMSASSAQVLVSVENSLIKTQDATKKTKQGIDILNQAVEDMEDIKMSISGLSIIITQLSESSVEIGNILNVIDDIADQTNLLALNAAIEAARAGDHGRGFAVVADEVRKLAERTQSATGEVEKIIKSLQEESSKANTSMKGALDSVNRGSKVIDETSGIFFEVSSAINEVSTNSTIVTNAVNEESRTILTVNDSIQVIASAIEESTKAVEETARTVAGLQELSVQQSNMIRKFKI